MSPGPAPALGFTAALRYSHGAAGDPEWAAAYRHAWPGCMMTDLRDDMAAQRAGIDRAIFRPDGALWATVDEKRRRRRYTGDVLLELVSDIDRGTPGWLTDPHKVCSHIATLYDPDRLCVLMPFDELRRAWAAREAEWKRSAAAGLPDVRGWIRGSASRHAGSGGFSLVRGQSMQDGRYWHTLNIAVPARALMQAIAAAMFIRWPSDGGQP